MLAANQNLPNKLPTPLVKAPKKAAMTDTTAATATAAATTPAITIASTPHESWGVLGEEHMKRASDKHLRTARLFGATVGKVLKQVHRDKSLTRAAAATMDDLLATLLMRLVAEAARLTEVQDLVKSFVPQD